MNITGLRTHDVVEVDKKGRRFLAHVRGFDGRDVEIMPITRETYRSCTSREIIGIWRATLATRRAKGLEVEATP